MVLSMAITSSSGMTPIMPLASIMTDKTTVATNPATRPAVILFMVWFLSRGPQPPSCFPS